MAGRASLVRRRRVLADLGIRRSVHCGRRQRARSRCRARAFLHAGQALLHARRARSGALLYPTLARRSAPLRHRRHRARRRTRAIASIRSMRSPASGPARKKALLQAFGSAKAVSRASASDLAAVEGVSPRLAQAIYDHFHEARNERMMTKPGRANGGAPIEAWSLPNILTYGRIAAVPVVAGLMMWGGNGARWTALALFIAAADHGFLRWLPGAEMADALLARPHARPHRRQGAGGGRSADLVSIARSWTAGIAGRRSLSSPARCWSRACANIWPNCRSRCR